MTPLNPPAPDAPKLDKIFPPGMPFRLLDAQIVGQQPSATGAVRTLAQIVVEDVEATVRYEFGVWGSLAQQLQLVEPGELPAIVTLSNASGQWQFAAHGPAPQQVTDPTTGQTVEQPMSAIPEAHLDLSGGETDNPTPVPSPGAPRGTEIDTGTAEPPTPLPGTAPPRGTGIDESQVFQPNSDPGRSA